MEFLGGVKNHKSTHAIFKNASDDVSSPSLTVRRTTSLKSKHKQGMLSERQVDFFFTYFNILSLLIIFFLLLLTSVLPVHN